MPEIKETELGNLQEAVKLLRKLAFGVQTVTRVKKFSNAQKLDLKKEGGGKGVRGFTCRNISNRIMYISTGASDEREPLYPEDIFAISGPELACDEQVQIEFGDVDATYTGPFNKQEAIVRFKVEIC
jgi:hypothetical protein